MGEKTEGGPAFPVREWPSHSGVSQLRWFAAHALVGMLAHPETNGTPEDIASACFKVAEAMIAEGDRRARK